MHSEHREQLFQQIKDFVPSFDILPVSEKFIFLMGADDPEILTPFIKFVKKCSYVRKDMFTKMQSASHQMPNSNNTLQMTPTLKL